MHRFEALIRTDIYLLMALFVLFGVTAAAQSQHLIITWGTNAPEWNRALGLTAIRLGCSDSPSDCLRVAERLADAQKVSRVFLAIRLDKTRTLSDAQEYSRLSLSHPTIYEVGFDDFVGQSQRQEEPLPALSRRLTEIARALKSANPQLRFGITLYMDELQSSRFRLAELDEDFRRFVDLVHLYPHYRKEAESFAGSLQQVRTVFPSAGIIAGLYAYDRRDYLPCAQGGRATCSNEEEISFFGNALDERWTMLQRGDINGIEFYPGNFGLEEQWTGWRNSRSCRSDRRQECIANTKQMREIVRTRLSH